RDAWEILRSFPRVGRWGYGPLAWVRGAPAMKPSPEAEVALTLVGIGQSSRLCDEVGTFFLLLEYMASERRAARPSPREVIEPTASSDGFSEYCRAIGRIELPHPKLTWQLLEREPPGVFGSRSYDLQNNAWTRVVSREVLELE